MNLTEKQKIGVLFSIIIIMLIFTTIMTYAYFTASAESKNAGEITFGHLELKLDNFNASVECCKDACKIVPGCKINFGGELVVDANIDCFMRVKFPCKVDEKDDEVFNEMANSCISGCLANHGWKGYDNYYYQRFNATDNNKELALSVIHIIIDEKIIGNEYQGKNVSFSVYAEAIQAKHLILPNGSIMGDLDSATEGVMKTLSNLSVWTSNGGVVDDEGDDGGEGAKRGKAGKEEGQDENDENNGADVIKYYSQGKEITGGLRLNQVGESIQIETQYCRCDSWEEFSPFEGLALQANEGANLKLTFDVELKDKGNNISVEAKQSFIEEVFVPYLYQIMFSGIVDSYDIDNCVLLLRGEPFESINNFYFTDFTEDYSQYAIKFILNIEVV